MQVDFILLGQLQCDKWRHYLGERGHFSCFICLLRKYYFIFSTFYDHVRLTWHVRGVERWWSVLFVDEWHRTWYCCRVVPIRQLVICCVNCDRAIGQKRFSLLRNAPFLRTHRGNWGVIFKLGDWRDVKVTYEFLGALLMIAWFVAGVIGGLIMILCLRLGNLYFQLTFAPRHLWIMRRLLCNWVLPGYFNSHQVAIWSFFGRNDIDFEIFNKILGLLFWFEGLNSTGGSTFRLRIVVRWCIEPYCVSFNCGCPFILRLKRYTCSLKTVCGLSALDMRTDYLAILSMFWLDFWAAAHLIVVIHLHKLRL